MPPVPAGRRSRLPPRAELVIQVKTAASLNVLGQRAAALASFPVPSCADPPGIFAALLGQIVTVAGEVGPDATLADLQQAVSQLDSVFSLESDFTAEVKQTTGT